LPRQQSEPALEPDVLRLPDAGWIEGNDFPEGVTAIAIRLRADRGKNLRAIRGPADRLPAGRSARDRPGTRLVTAHDHDSRRELLMVEPRERDPSAVRRPCWPELLDRERRVRQLPLPRT